MIASKPIGNPEAPRKPNGEGYRCRLARHIPSLRLQGMWCQIERLCNVSEYEKANAGKPRDQWEFPILFAAIATLADACNCSYNTARACIKEFVKKGLLTPRFVLGKEAKHSRSGRWQTHDYDVTLHDAYARFCPCPRFRFIRRDDGVLGVRAESRKVAPEKVSELIQRFKNKAQTWIDAVMCSADPELYYRENPPPRWPQDVALSPEEWVELRRKELQKSETVAKN